MHYNLLSKLAKKSLEETNSIIQQFGPRLNGTEPCHKAANYLFQKLNSFCDEAKIENFKFHPGSFIFYIRFNSVMYSIGVILFYFKSKWVIFPLVGLFMGIFMMISIFGLYKHFFDKFFPAKIGKNVYGVIEPSSEVNQQIILSGHHDSARKIRILDSGFQKLYAMVILTPYFFFIFEIVVILVGLFNDFENLWFSIILIVFLNSFPFILLYFFIVTKDASPGAGDNLIASVFLIELGKYLTSQIKEKKLNLKHTRIIIASFDAEESGLRGSAAFMKIHKENIKQIPTFHLNFDSLYNLNELHVLTKDINGFISLSEKMVNEIVKIGIKEKISIKKFKMVFGGGATDAAESARIGIPSTTLIAMPTNIIRDGLVYHTSRDTVEHIEPAVVESCIKIAWNYIWDKERTKKE
ncbi:M28 family metallopeptidase [Candidatus Harpocratesius sp.]